jgi:hypothetical protein
MRQLTKHILESCIRLLNWTFQNVMKKSLKIRKGLSEVVIRKKIDNTNGQKKKRVKTSNGRHRKLRINNDYSLYILYHIIFTPFKPRQDITEILPDIVTH